MKISEATSSTKMKFRNLPVGAVFHFDHSGLLPTHGLEPGPWRKISARKYVKHTSPFSLSVHDRNEHEIWSKLECRVGTINATVIRA